MNPRWILPVLIFSYIVFLGGGCRTNHSTDPGNDLNISYSATLQPSVAQIRPGQSVTFTFSAVEEPGKRPLNLSSESLEWTLEGTPAYPVGTAIGLPDPPTGTSLKGRFDAAPSLPNGVTTVQFTLRTKLKGGLLGQVVQATSKITLDVNAPPAAEPALVQEGGTP